MTTFIFFEKKITHVVSCCIACNVIIDDQIKAKLNYVSDVSCKPSDHSKCDKMCGTDITNKQGNFKTKSP